MTATEKMKVEIWSDVMCPFCYIGKRRFEDALVQFAHKDQVEIEWKSFQLNPDLKKAEDIKQTLDSHDFADAVKHDIAEAQYLGIQGVPFFVMNNKYGVSGAQAVPVFAETLEKSFGDWQLENTKPKLTVIEGESCSPDSDCG